MFAFFDFSLEPVEFWAQVTGLFCFFLGILCFYQKKDRYLKLNMLALNLNYLLHFILLGAHTAALSSVLSFFRTALAIKFSSPPLAWFFIFVALLWGGYLATEWVDLIPIFATCIGTYALFCMQGIRMRVALLVGTCFWLVNNIVVGSLGGVLLESTLITVNVTTIYRLTISKDCDKGLTKPRP